MRGPALAVSAALAACVWGLAAPASGGAAGTVALSVRAPVVVPLGEPVHLTVSVAAPAGALDSLTAPARVRVRVARACGPTFGTTHGGVTAVDVRLSPAPVAGSAYHGRATGHVTPRSYGYRFVCAFLEQEGNGLQLARDTASVIVTTHRCTEAARARESALRRLAVARHSLRLAGDPASRRALSRRVASLRAAAIRARRAAQKACRVPRVG